jgi:hypothetical protein
MENKNSSVESVIESFYRCFQFDAGEGPDLAGLQSCFSDIALIVPPSTNAATALNLIEFLSYVESIFSTERQTGANEYEVAAQRHIFLSIAQVFSQYEFAAAGAIRSRGVNSFQLRKFNDLWLIVSLCWDRETTS